MKKFRDAGFNEMVEAKMSTLFAPIDPDVYADALQALTEEYQPVGAEVQLVERLAHLSCRIRICFYLQSELLNAGIKATRAGGDRQAMRPFHKVSAYHSRLFRQFEECLRRLKRLVDDRRRRDALAAEAFSQYKLATSVVQ